MPEAMLGDQRMLSMACYRSKAIVALPTRG